VAALGQVEVVSAAVLLVLATALIVPCALVIFVRDVRVGSRASPSEWRMRPETSRLRIVAESALPFIGVVLLVGLTWAAL
jgi:hypothetical protein